MVVPLAVEEEVEEVARTLEAVMFVTKATVVAVVVEVVVVKVVEEDMAVGEAMEVRIYEHYLYDNYLNSYTHTLNCHVSKGGFGGGGGAGRGGYGGSGGYGGNFSDGAW